MRQRGFPHRFSHEQFIAEFAPLVQSLNPTALKPTAAAPLPRDVCRMIAEQVGLLRRLASAPHACACAHPCVRVYISSERLQRRTSGALQSEVNAALGRSRAVPSAPPIVVGSSAILQSMLSSVAIVCRPCVASRELRRECSKVGHSFAMTARAFAAVLRRRLRLDIPQVTAAAPTRARARCVAREARGARGGRSRLARKGR